MVLRKGRLVFINTGGKATFIDKEASRDLGVQEHQVYASNQMSLCQVSRSHAFPSDALTFSWILGEIVNSTIVVIQ